MFQTLLCVFNIVGVIDALTADFHGFTCSFLIYAAIEEAKAACFQIDYNYSFIDILSFNDV
jgi:hypothetical protein